MKIFAISDLHLSFSTDKPMDIFGDGWQNHFEQIKEDWNKKVDESDVVLIAGDISWAMNIEQARADINEIGLLKGKKIIIRGNHDYWWSSYQKVQNILPEGTYAVQNNALQFDNYIICGTRGWTIPEDEYYQEKKYIDREAIRLDMSIKAAKALRQNNEKIILMMHYPPFNSRYDDSVFTNIIAASEIETVVYGHLHGKNIRCKMIVNKGVTDYYLTSCDILNNKLLELPL